MRHGRPQGSSSSFFWRQMGTLEGEGGEGGGLATGFSSPRKVGPLLLLLLPPPPPLMNTEAFSSALSPGRRKWRGDDNKRWQPGKKKGRGEGGGPPPSPLSPINVYLHTFLLSFPPIPYFPLPPPKWWWVLYQGYPPPSPSFPLSPTGLISELEK